MQTSFVNLLLRAIEKGLLLQNPIGKERCIPPSSRSFHIFQSEQRGPALCPLPTRFARAVHLSAHRIALRLPDPPQARGETHVLCDEEIQ